MSSNPSSVTVKSHRQIYVAEPAAKVASSFAGDYQDIDVTKRDRFELLSAYVDGELTSEDRQMVLDWMNSDPKARCLYNRLMRLRQGLRDNRYDPCRDADIVADQVFKCLNYRMKLMGMAGAGVFVLGVLSLLSGGIGQQRSVWGWAAIGQSESLEIALDQPAFPIPKAPTAAMVIDSTAEGAGVLPVESEL